MIYMLGEAWHTNGCSPAGKSVVLNKCAYVGISAGIDAASNNGWCFVSPSIRWAASLPQDRDLSGWTMKYLPWEN